MKKYLFIIAAAAMCMLAACSKEKEQIISEENVPVVKHLPGWTYISALAGDESGKASIDGTSAAFSWNTGDRIAVFSGSTYHLSDALASNFDGTNNAEFAFDGDIEADRTNFAIYPASLVLDGTSVRTGCEGDYTADYLTIMLPGSYTLADVQDNVSPTPMIAVNAPGSGLSFKSVCALVRISVKNVPKDAACLKVCFPGKRVQGYFSLENFVAGTDGVIVEPSSDEGDDTITITNLGISSFTDLVINVPVPTGVASSQEYLYVRVGAYDSTDHKINSIDTPLKVSSSIPTAWAPGRLASKKVTAKLPVFTAADGKYVVFSPGNLQATLGATFETDKPSYASSWNFAQHQYDAIGNTLSGEYSINSFRKPAVGQVFDLFAWFGADAASAYTGDYADDKYKYGIIRNSSNIAAFTGSVTTTLLLNWGHNVIDDFPADIWRVLTKDEWNKVIFTREGGLFVRATLSESNTPIAHGLIITPDQYSHPYGVAPFNNTNKTDGACSDNTFSLNDWQKLEAAGCVFLPLTNQRTKSSNLETINPGEGWYWTNNGANSKKAYAVYFNDFNVGNSSTSASANTVRYDKSIQRYVGNAVRLIRDVN